MEGWEVSHGSNRAWQFQRPIGVCEARTARSFIDLLIKSCVNAFVSRA